MGFGPESAAFGAHATYSLAAFDWNWAVVDGPMTLPVPYEEAWSQFFSLSWQKCGKWRGKLIIWVQPSPRGGHGSMPSLLIFRGSILRQIPQVFREALAGLSSTSVAHFYWHFLLPRLTFSAPSLPVPGTSHQEVSSSGLRHCVQGNTIQVLCSASSSLFLLWLSLWLGPLPIWKERGKEGKGREQQKKRI